MSLIGALCPFVPPFLPLLEPKVPTDFPRCLILEFKNVFSSRLRLHSVPRVFLRATPCIFHCIAARFCAVASISGDFLFRFSTIPDQGGLPFLHSFPSLILPLLSLAICMPLIFFATRLLLFRWTASLWASLRGIASLPSLFTSFFFLI